MIIWFDAVTSKEPLLFNAIANALEKEGHEIIFTCRDYDYVVTLFELLEKDVTVLGKHGGGTLYGKLLAGNERINLLANYINSLEKTPDYHISYSCPESTRVAFGLAIQTILVNDSPHAKAVGKLTIPLSKFLVYSSCIQEREWYKLGAIKEQLQPYDGLDEVAWIRDFSPNDRILEELGLSKQDNFIVCRPEESSAAYMLEKGMVDQTHLDTILKEIFKLYDGKAIVFPRYAKQKLLLKEMFQDKIIIPPKAVDTLSLYYYSDMCITGGATMAREAASMGTPSISYYPKSLDVLEYISSIGIPLFNEYTIESAIQRSLKLLEKVDDKDLIRYQTKIILEKLDSPVEKILEII